MLHSRRRFQRKDRLQNFKWLPCLTSNPAKMIFKSTTGNLLASLRVCMSVSASNNSSRVPKPPRNTTNASKIHEPKFTHKKIMKLKELWRYILVVMLFKWHIETTSIRRTSTASMIPGPPPEQIKKR